MKMKFVQNKKLSGCTDDGHQNWSKYPGYSACNYNPKYIQNDGSCEYDSCLGCTDPQCDESYDIKYKIPAQKFYGYGECEPCSYLSLPRNFYPPIKTNKFASTEDKFIYERGGFLYDKPFGELSFGYVTKNEVKKITNGLKKILNQFKNYDLWVYGEIIDNIPSRDIKTIITIKKGNAILSEIQNLMMMCINLSLSHNVCIDIRFHHKDVNGNFYSKSFPSGQNLKISTIVPYDMIKYNGRVIEINNGKKIENKPLWQVFKYFPDKNKTKYYKNKKYIDHGPVHINDDHLLKHINNYQIELLEYDITPDSIDFIKKRNS